MTIHATYSQGLPDEVAAWGEEVEADELVMHVEQDQDGRYVALVPAYNVAASADTEEEAIQRATDLLVAVLRGEAP
jgi:hypothetical protein